MKQIKKLEKSRKVSKDGIFSLRKSYHSKDNTLSQKINFFYFVFVNKLAINLKHSTEYVIDILNNSKEYLNSISNRRSNED